MARSTPASLVARYARITEGRLRADIVPILGNKPVRSIMPRMVMEALRAIEARGSIEMANRLKNHCSKSSASAFPMVAVSPTRVATIPLE